MSAYHVLDLFAGPGGWDEALRLLGVEGVVGVELDPDACETARAAGFERHQADIRTVKPAPYLGVVGLVASPPCQTFSRGGKQQGTDDLDDLAEAVAAVLGGADVTSETEDARSSLVLEPARFIAELRPRWIAFEEVREVLPVWEAYAQELEALGYSSWAGILNAADFGVPQSRKRAFMLASRDGHVEPPIPTHARYADQGLWDARQTWINMGDALGWTAADAIAANEAAPEPALDPVAAQWVMSRPSTTIVRSFRPEVVSPPGYRQRGDGPRQNQCGAVVVTVEETCILQGLRTDYPFRANSETKLRSLVGAILPPVWGAKILAPLVEMSRSACRECGNDDPHFGHALCLDCLEVSA